MNAKKIFLVFLCLIAFSAMSWAGGDQEGESTSMTGPIGERSWEADTSPITIKLYLDRPEDYDQAWGKNLASKRMIAETGVNLQWIMAPDSDHTKLNVIIASGDFPDAMWVDPDLPQVVKLAEHDQIWALNELSAKEAPFFMSRVPDNMLVKNRMEFESMNLYRANFYFVPPDKLDDPYVIKNFNGTTLIKELYDAVGSPKVETGDDYIDLLRKIKQKYPDMIPMIPNRSTGTDYFGSPRLVYIAKYNAGLGSDIAKIGNKYGIYWEHPNFMHILKFASTVYHEGLVPEDIFTISKSHLRSWIDGGEVFSELNQDADNLGGRNKDIAKINPDWHWMMIEPFTFGPGMEYAADQVQGGAGSQGIVIPKGNKYDARVMRWLDYLYSDELQLKLVFGEEGEQHFINSEGLPEYRPEFLEWSQNPANSEEAGLVGLVYPSVFRNFYYKAVRDIQEARRGDPYMVQAFEIAKKYYKDFTLFEGSYNFPPNSDELKAFSLIKEYYSNEVVKIVVGDPGNIETHYNQMLARMRSLGLDLVNDFITNSINAKADKIKKYSADL